jgi:hypothetical protein
MVLFYRYIILIILFKFEVPDHEGHLWYRILFYKVVRHIFLDIGNNFSEEEGKISESSCSKRVQRKENHFLFPPRLTLFIEEYVDVLSNDKYWLGNPLI